MNVGGKKMLVIIDMQNHILDPNSSIHTGYSSRTEGQRRGTGRFAIDPSSFSPRK